MARSQEEKCLKAELLPLIKSKRKMRNSRQDLLPHLFSKVSVKIVPFSLKEFKILRRKAKIGRHYQLKLTSVRKKLALMRSRLNQKTSS
jgi:hypothetical protein